MLYLVPILSHFLVVKLLDMSHYLAKEIIKQALAEVTGSKINRVLEKFRNPL